MFGKLMASEVGGVSVQMIDPVQARIYQAQPDGSLRVLATRNGISEIAVLRDTMGQRVEAIQLDHHAARIRVISDQGSRCYDSHSLRLLSHCEGALAWMP